MYGDGRNPHTFASGDDVGLIVIDGRRETQVSDRAGMTVTGQGNRFR